MPVEFLSDEQAARYGRYQADPTPEQLARFFYLSSDDLVFIARRRRRPNQLGCAVQLCTLRFLGTFLPDPTHVPAVVVEALAAQLHVAPAEWAAYGKRVSTWYEHQPGVVAYLGYAPFEAAQAFRLTRWLYAQVATSTVRPSVLFDLATAHLVTLRVVLPGVTVLARLIARVRERTGRHLYRQVVARLNAPQQQALEALLVALPGERLTPLEVLRTSPTRVSAPALVAALRRLDQVRTLGVSDVSLRDLPEARLARMARHAQLAWAQPLLRMGQERRLATLLAFVQALERTATDDILELFDGLMSALALRGEAKRRRERLRSLKDLDQAALLLQQAVRILLDESVPDAALRQRVLGTLGETALREAADAVQELASSEDDPMLQVLAGSYATVRRFLPALLSGLVFDGSPSANSLLDAWHFLQEQEKPGRGRLKWAAAPAAVIPKSWARRVFPAKGEVNPQAYTLCVLDRLHQALRRREVFVPSSERYGDPRAELLRGEVWEAARDSVARALDRSTDPAVELARLQEQLHAAYTEVSANLAQNTALQLLDEGGLPYITLTPLAAREEPASLTHLREQLAGQLPPVELAALLLEVEAFTGFASAFTHVADGQTAATDLPLSICAVLLAQACNIGLKTVARAEVPALTLPRLSWVQQNYVRAETLTVANARLVDGQAQLPLAQAWGGGEVASADGMRFVVPVRTIYAGWNSKYFASQRGVTYYNFTSNQFSGFHGIVIPGTLRDSLFILAGLLEQQTSLDPREIMADTHGFSEVVFGLFSLLGFRFSPRLADLPDQRFWRLQKEDDYGPLDELGRHVINARLIAEHWDDMLRLAGSLKLGKVKATAVMRTLQRGGSLSGLGRAVAELGRVEKTLYLLAYVHDEAYRRRILVQLNRGEGRHALARAVFHGKKGELRQRYREGMEDQLGALGLVVNALVLWNTRYLQQALAQWPATEGPLAPDDVARLSPLLHEHVNMLGRYDFTLPERIAAGELRPLRNPENWQERFAPVE
ncbi:Tn3 family transposase [Hymenobacter psychrophilus]|uniref:Transposase and inactivated derivatives, TnpA family n=1 Tax=Hymenobacter psychrophilus TaxID=651662 RepID=A0A1H3NYN7_9BACT|nr:Tn3 family transposase [Hymenobacter psychrophilus]SDY93918.1 Transposase and inactivated derivatives, TnpA family [Hymenobacter psychrophilus]